MLCIVADLARCAFIAILFAVVTAPRVFFAQGTVDEAKIVECIQSVEKDAALKIIDVDAAAAKCADHGRDHCMEGAVEKWGWSPAFGACNGATLEIWRRLLVQAYEAAITAQREGDRLKRESYSNDEPLLPAFVEAHEKWVAFVGAECALKHAEASKGTYNLFGIAKAMCETDLTARRVFLYRARARTLTPRP